MSETDLQQKIRKALQQRFGGWWRKIHGGPFQHAGIPDLLGCVRGMFIGLEVKVPGKEARLSAAQKAEIEAIVQQGLGAAGMVTSVGEALQFVADILGESL